MLFVLWSLLMALLKWVVSRYACEVKVKVAQSCLTLCNPMDWLYSPWILQARILDGVGSLFLLQGIFPTQGSNPDLPHCRWILCQLRHKGSPGKLEWVAYPFSRRSSRPRNQTGVSCIAGGFFTNRAMREALDTPVCYDKRLAMHLFCK